MNTNRGMAPIASTSLSTIESLRHRVTPLASGVNVVSSCANCTVVDKTPLLFGSGWRMTCSSPSMEFCTIATSASVSIRSARRTRAGSIDDSSTIRLYPRARSCRSRFIATRLFVLLTIASIESFVSIIFVYS